MADVATGPRTTARVVAGIAVIGAARVMVVTVGATGPIAPSARTGTTEGSGPSGVLHVTVMTGAAPGTAVVTVGATGPIAPSARTGTTEGSGPSGVFHAMVMIGVVAVMRTAEARVPEGTVGATAPIGRNDQSATTAVTVPRGVRVVTILEVHGRTAAVAGGTSAICGRGISTGASLVPIGHGSCRLRKALPARNWTARSGLSFAL